VKCFHLGISFSSPAVFGLLRNGVRIGLGLGAHFVSIAPGRRSNVIPFNRWARSPVAKVRLTGSGAEAAASGLGAVNGHQGQSIVRVVFDLHLLVLRRRGGPSYIGLTKKR